MDRVLYADVPRFHALLRDLERVTGCGRRRLLQIAGLPGIPSVKLGNLTLVDADVVFAYLFQMDIAGSLKHHMW